MIFRLMSGLALGLEIAPTEGVYVVLYLGIVEMMFVSKDFIEEHYE